MAIQVPTPPDRDEEDVTRFEEMTGFEVREAFSGYVEMVPTDPVGTVHPYFRAHRLCDASTPLGPEVWEPLREHPAYEDPNAARRQRLIQYANELREQPARLTSAIEMIGSMVAALPNETLPDFLTAQMPELFQLFPNGSLWLVSVDDLLLARLMIMHGASAYWLTPDLPMRQESFPGFESLDDHSLTRGVDFGRLIDPMLVSYSPTTAGYAFEWQPHALVFLFGEQVSLVQEQIPMPLSMLYEPRFFEPLEDELWVSEALHNAFRPDRVEDHLRWWVDRLNVFYSFAADPRSFVDSLTGFNDPQRSRGWLLSFERMIGDASAALAGVHKPAIDRLNAVFDFLDKAEALLGYGSDRSGRGFKQLVTRGQALRRFDHYRSNLPESIRPMLRRNAQSVFDRVCSKTYDGVVDHRKGRNAVLVDNPRHDQPHPKPLDDYVADLIRATRNSSHGLLEQLGAQERHVIGVHRGGLPTEVALLTGPLLTAFAAGAEDFCAQRWL